LRWQPPRWGQVKCNVDASFSDQFNRTGIGIFVCGDEGTFVLTKTIHITLICSVPLGEALALYYALEWLSDMSFDNQDFHLISKLL